MRVPVSAAAGLAAFVAAGLSVALPGLLTGVPAADGNLRGTAVVVLLAGLPVLIAAMILTALGSARALVVWLGALGYLLYQAVMFCFATPINQLFLAYVAFLGLALWSIPLFLRETDLSVLGPRLPAGPPLRVAGGLALVLVALNGGAWLGRIVPAVLRGNPESLVAATGLLTNPVYVQDLGVWLPLLTVSAVACLRARPWGVLVTAAMLVMFVLESVSISVDQWFGVQAAPTSEVSSSVMVPVFAAVAAIIAVPLCWFLYRMDRSR